jgi:DNA-binding beta-propeller fold protein YncE
LAGWSQAASSGGSYKVLKTAKVGGVGGYDYVDADEAGRRLFVARSGQGARVTVFNLDTLEPAGEIPNVSGHGAVVSRKSGHGFVSSKPVTMFDSKTLAPIKTIEVQSNPDGMFYDAFNDHVYVLSHQLPQVTVINAADGNILGTIDLGGQAEEMVSDGKGHLYVDVEDKGNVAVIDAKSMTVTAHYDLEGKGGTCAGLALDAKNHILFAACRNPQGMVILNAEDGKIITTLPIGAGTDGAQFNPKTMEAFSSNTDGTLTVVKENSPSSFVVEQVLQTMTGAKTVVLDSKTNHLYLIAAEYAAPAAGAPAGPGGRAPRGPMVPDSFSILVVGK